MSSAHSAGFAEGDHFRKKIKHWWRQAARHNKTINLTDFDPSAPLSNRINWARGKGLLIGSVFTRRSVAPSKSLAFSVRRCLAAAVAHAIYVPPEWVFVAATSNGMHDQHGPDSTGHGGEGG